MKTIENEKIKKGLAFGVFDGLHPGHRHFLAEAKKYCANLTVAVAPNDVVMKLKGHYPKQTEEERKQALEAFDENLRVISGDQEPGSWNVLAKEKPDMVFLGYDQKALAEELQKLNISFQTIAPHEPEKYKTSLLK